MRTTPSSTARTGVRSRTRSPSRRARASASPWLPPASRWLGSGANAATCSSTLASSRSAPCAEEISTRASTASATASGSPSPRHELGDGAAAAGRGRLRQRRAGRLQVGARRGHAARLAHVVAHAGVDQLQPLAGGEAAQRVVAVEDELRAALDHRRAGRALDAVRPHAAADAVARLEHEHVARRARRAGRPRRARRSPRRRRSSARSRAVDDAAADHRQLHAASARSRRPGPRAGRGRARSGPPRGRARSARSAPPGGAGTRSRSCASPARRAT